VRGKVNESIEPLRAAGQLGKSLDTSIRISAKNGDPTFLVLKNHSAALPEIFIVSHVALDPEEIPFVSAGSITTADGTSQYTVSPRPATELGYVRCPRCWRWVPALEKSPHGDVCPRCIEALKS
jgi:isoleucyl-tRNA synthetase